MDKWLAAIPKPLLATLAIVGGILFIVFSDPPKTLCDTQLEVLRKSQEGFLTPDKNSKIQTTPGFQKFITQCKIANSPGGCYEFFMKMKVLLEDLKDVPDECMPEVSSGDVLNSDAVQPAIFQTLTLMMQLAWGEKPPETYHEKFGWLDTADMTLFCDLKRTAQKTYGREAWEPFQERMFRELPGAADLSRKAAWDAMLLSMNCNRYP